MEATIFKTLGRSDITPYYPSDDIDVILQLIYGKSANFSGSNV